MSLLPIPPDVSVLNCGAGDMTFSFDANDPLESARAERVVIDMLKRGYLLFAKVDDKYVRVMEFDAARHEYIIADGPQSAPHYGDGGDPREQPAEPQLKKPPGRPRNVRRGRRVPASGTPVTGIAPTAGG